MKDVTEITVGEIIEFKSYALRVEAVTIDGNWVRFTGRKSTDGCPIVRKAFLKGTLVNIR